jgi:hypothetical protein
MSASRAKRDTLNIRIKPEERSLIDRAAQNRKKPDRFYPRSRAARRRGSAARSHGVDRQSRSLCGVRSAP